MDDVAQLLDRLTELLGLDPFAYLAVTILAIFVWTWSNLFGGFALTGRGIWFRWLALFTAGMAAVLFVASARQLG